jgi:hypothetical protein
VKPTVSAGARDTSRYGPEQHAEATSHISRLLGEGRAVMVQPYLDGVDRDGETGMVFFDGEFSHAFAKAPLLGRGAAAVEGLFAPEKITQRVPTADQLDLAQRVIEATGRHLGSPALLYARVDVLPDADGQPCLLELELTEPSFFLETDPAAPARAASAILGWALRSVDAPE